MRRLPFYPARLHARAMHRVYTTVQVHDLRGEQPLRPGLRQRRTGKDAEPAFARAAVIAALVLARDIGGQAGEQGEMDGFVKFWTRDPGLGTRRSRCSCGCVLRAL